MKRPLWVTIASIGGLIFLCSGLAGICTGTGLEMAMVQPVIEKTSPPEIATFTPIQPVNIQSETPAETVTYTESFTVTIGDSPTETFPPTASETPPLDPSPTLSPAVTVLDGFEMLSYSDSVSPGGTAFAKIQTKPAVACSIQYYTPAGTDSTAQGLAPQTSDAEGYCSWVWNIGSRTKPGKGRIVVSANRMTKEFPIQVN
jgi:hypothetical protein